MRIFGRFTLTCLALLLAAAPGAAQDRAALAERIAQLSASDSLDSWPMAERTGPRYVLAWQRAHSDEDGFLSQWHRMSATGCTLLIEAGLIATGPDLPQRRMRLDLANPQARFDIYVDRTESGYAILEVTSGDTQQVIETIPIAQNPSDGEIRDAMQAQHFRSGPVTSYPFMLNFPKGEPGPAVVLLKAIKDYRTTFCTPIG